MRTSLLLPWTALLFGSCGAEGDALIGRWRAAHGPEIEFFSDGTVNLGGGFGARYRIADDGRLQVEQELIGPVTLWYEMHGDSLRLEGGGVLSGDTLVLYRDSGAQSRMQYTLAGKVSIRGTCTEVYGLWNPSVFGQAAPERTRQRIIPLGARFSQGELILDPVTRAFTQTLNLELQQGEGEAMSRARPVSATLRGRYAEQNGVITLSYQGEGALPSLVGRREGARIRLPGGELFRVLQAPTGPSGYGSFHSGMGNHTVAWDAIPDLSFREQTP